MVEEDVNLSQKHIYPETFFERSDFKELLFDRRDVMGSETIIKCKELEWIYISPKCKGIKNKAICDCDNLRYVVTIQNPLFKDEIRVA